MIMASEEPDKVLELVVYYLDPKSHQEGANKFLGGKERRRVRLSKDELARFSTFQSAIVDKNDLKAEAEQRGLGRDITIKMARIAKDREGAKSFSISNQDSLELELQALLETADMSSCGHLQGKNFLNLFKMSSAKTLDKWKVIEEIVVCQYNSKAESDKAVYLVPTDTI